MKLKPSGVLNEKASVEDQNLYHLLCILLHLTDKSNCTITFHANFLFLYSVHFSRYSENRKQYDWAQTCPTSFPLTKRTGICFSSDFLTCK